MRRLSTCIAVVLIFAGANSALASWWVVRSSDGKCLVVDIVRRTKLSGCETGLQGTKAR